MYIMSELWQRLRQARRFADQTQMQLAQCCGVSRAAVALWEAAEPEHRTKPTTDHLVHIAKCTTVPLEWLLNDASDLNDVWRLAEYSPGRFLPTDTGAPSIAGPVTGPRTPPDVLPDFQADGTLFCFAATPEQFAAKLHQIAGRTDAHLVLIGVSATVSCAATPAAALAQVVQALAAQKPTLP